MSHETDRRLALVFALLTGVTLLSWWLGAGDDRQAFSPDAALSLAVILMAAIKLRMIVWEFMELRHAPLRVRRGADGFLWGIVGVMLLVYAFGSRMQV
ncbi:hypothetical protein C3942_20455 [Solimonas fluminis]|uniref:Prokaryotic cytochrome C oxidase subunit IV family protein n=1 Tax=Solimonas fluminis TaxID=2086571 RepID=A0A2S5TAP0_9GAMM|nr:cytochrome C oxidase subunit IV family protein [Solimonas fluminis]PPE72070.1 hypothetical protein C3942_20455 [Solimonas fluminis]